MIRINLLPPEERIARARKGPAVPWFALPLGAAGAVTLLAFASAGMQAARIQSLHKDIVKAEAETASLAPQIQRISLLARERADMDLRMSLLKRLEGSRYVRVQMLDELSRQLPDHVWITTLRENGPGRVQVEGVTFSNLMVADFMQRLDSSPLYEAVDLTVSERGTMEDRDVLKFTLTAQVSADLGATAEPPQPKQGVRRRES
ncbi:MAG: PilN domain-containing protein [Candidatus Eisenbacteria bacterium]|nr:PilN domain-containing protein [Candidatus Eisenbacteria bacterium]